MSWQPIDTAPMRKPVLIQWRNADMAVMTKDVDGWWLCHDFTETKEEPLCWQPLPKWHLHTEPLPSAPVQETKP